jgi:AbrB family looped-hinge helix DNA binding protein
MKHTTAKLSSKFQISIPKSVREAEGWKAGQVFVFIPKGKGVLVVPVPDRSALTGIAKAANPENYRDRSDRF